MKTVSDFRLVLTLLVVSVWVCLAQTAQCQTDSVRIMKGSYLHYGHSFIEDNSMYLEEAFNQGEGVVQFISGTLITNNILETSFEIEIPLAGEKHQLSAGSSYISSTSDNLSATDGFGDIRVSYRPQLSGKHHWAMVIPRVTLAFPRKNTADEFEYSRPSVELAIAVTKRLSKKLTSHINGSVVSRVTHIFSSHKIAGSVIWALRPQFNFMLESVYENSADQIGNFESTLIINPAVRFSFALGQYQIIPGFGAPLSFDKNSDLTPGAFFYLSVEPF